MEKHHDNAQSTQAGDSAPPLTATALVTLSACGQIYPSKDPAQGPANGVKSDVSQVVVGFAQQQLQAPYFAAMQVRAQEIAKEQGFKLLFQAANKDPVIQMNQMQAMMAQGADVLVVNATSVKGQKEMMTQIASKIPVTYIDTSVPGTGMTSVQSDNLTIGRESGKITAKRFLDAGKTEHQDGRSSPARPPTSSSARTGGRGSSTDSRRAACRSRSRPSRPGTTPRTRARSRPRTCSPATPTST